MAGGGEMGALMRAHDWSRSPLGQPEHWPDALKMAVSICLNSRFPMVLWWGADCVMLYNDAWRPVLGASKHPSGLGRPGIESWPEIWDIIGEQMRGVLQRGEASWSEDLLLVFDRYGYQEEAYFTYSYSPIKHADGTIGGVFSAVSETTERVLGERRLRILRELADRTAEAKSVETACRNFAAVLGGGNPDIPFAMLYLDAEDHSAVHLLASTGFDPDGVAAPLRIHPSDDDPWHIAEVVRTGSPLLLEDLQQRFGDLPGGAWPEPTRSALVLPVARTGQRIETTGVLVAGINPRRALDERYRSFLELVAGQMATAVANARAYEEERKRAEALAEIDRAKTTFFSNVSHEFRTPLTLMLGPMEELAARLTSADRQQDRALLETAHRNGLRLLKLVNSLLDFSRIEAGRVQAQLRPTDLAGLTAEIASTFRSAIEQAGLRFVIECPPLPEPVYVDPDMWEKVVLNLISNALKFTFEGEIAVTVGCAPGGLGAEVSVRDTGTGIPEHELPHLFERFHRIEGAKGRTFEGSGIGLALVQELVKLHNGSIRVESQLERGTTFTITMLFGAEHLPTDRIGGTRAAPAGLRAQAYVEEALSWLPREDGGSPEEALVRSVVDDFDLPTAAEASGRVLLADDNADMREYVCRLLVDQGYEVEAVPDGEIALTAARRRAPDLVLSDIMMPGLDGIALLRELRSDPALRDIPVVLLSARAGEEAKVEGLRVGADDYLVKPFSARELIARVASNLDLARVRKRHAEALREEAHRLEILNRTAATVSAELELEPLVQAVTDAATELTGAKFGAFFYNITNDAGQSYLLYTLSGASREDFAGFPQPRNTEVFGPTFRGEGVVRSGDIRKDPRYGKSAPYHGPPKGHLPVVSYLAVPVIAPTAEVLGGLFFAHPEPDRFTEQHELIVTGIAAHAATAFEKARLYQASGKAEADLRRLNESLEERVTEEIERRRQAEAELRQAQKMEAIGQLTGGVAHDMNNILLVIQSSLERLQRHAAFDEEAARAVQLGLRGAERAAALTNQLLAFARRQPLDPRPVDANRLLAGMSDLLRRTLGESVAIETVLAGGLWQTFADPNQIENAILNLAVNARDAMPDGGRLTIETANTYLDESYAAAHHEVKPGQYVMIAVSDTGTGMAKETVERAFEPFFTTKEPGRGTGLGLSQVYGFVKQSGGHAKIYSEPGEGATVRMYLPRHLCEDVCDASEPSVVLPAAKGEAVLVVEDDDDVRANTVESLRELGYRVVAAANGSEALRLLAENPAVRLIFTDVGLPGGMNGRQLADKARGLRPDLKVLFTTGYARNAIVHHGRLDPGVELLVKPYTYAALAAKLRQVLDH
jgi:signal transduction histidine kinase/DNA-binding response OmpR family regulator